MRLAYTAGTSSSMLAEPVRTYMDKDHYNAVDGININDFGYNFTQQKKWQQTCLLGILNSDTVRHALYKNSLQVKPRPD